MTLSAEIFKTVRPAAITLVSVLLCVCILLLSSVAWTSTVHASSNEESPISVGLITGAYPFVYSQNDKKVGLMLDYIPDAFKVIPYSYEFLFYDNYLRMFQAIILGHIDATFLIKASNAPLPYTPNITCTDAINNAYSYGFFALAERNIKRTSSMIDLFQYRVAVVRSTQRSMLSGFDDNNITQHSTTNDIYKMLISKRTDLAMIPGSIAVHWQQKFGMRLSEVMYVGNATVHLCISEQKLNSKTIEAILQAVKAQPKISTAEFSPLP